ncbi:hypothetical protein [Meiothermus sp.]|jgi:hypothetical protein|uniref:hypothetical protein n=1 Tax=Meiothermus sp. TaxID=1955249 RepID=UPI0021DEEAB6|nr:hypothetical protein [Meiothermus sp.]GIW26121.1 MAG: hypothetical protein KatS3mg069_2388 [Meiothermus sp.]
MVHLDGPIYYLGALERPLLIQTGPPLALLFTSCDIARQFPSVVTDLGNLEVQQIQDWRGKEEFLKALVLQGIEIYLLDPNPHQPLRAARHAVRAALIYVQSHKKQTACL